MDAAALMKWAPGPEETKETVEVEFFPSERQ
jgi:hypothetical protein